MREHANRVAPRLDDGEAGAQFAADPRPARRVPRSLQRPIGGCNMRYSFILLAAAIVAVPAAAAGPAEDATVSVTSTLDRFNGGDVAAFLQAHRDDAVIIDEFAPYVWAGAGTAQRWVADYSRDAEARGISGGRVDYGAAVQAVSDGNSAYIVLPTTYSFTQNGRRMASPGHMTFVMSRDGGDWKIASWTYSGGTPAPQ